LKTLHKDRIIGSPQDKNLHALQDHYELINNQLLHLKEAEEVALSDYRKRANLTPEDPEWDFARQECEHKVEFLLPRVFNEKRP